MNVQALFLSPRGRIARKPYWLGSLLLVATQIVGMMLLFALLGWSMPEGQDDGTLAISFGGGSPMFAALASLLSLVVGICSLMLTIKRCHDRDRSGWFFLVTFIPLVGPIWLLVELGFLPGTPGPNRFGPDPLQPAALPPYLPA